MVYYSDTMRTEQARIWISWAYQRRSDELAKAFGAEYHPIGTIFMGRLGRYRHCLPRTIGLIHGRRPAILFVQNPSILLAAMASVLKMIYGYTLVNDLHTPYITLGGFRERLFWSLQRFCVNRSDMTIVTNAGVKGYFSHDNIYILPDKLPHIPGPPDAQEPPGTTPRKKGSLEGTINIAYVSSFAEDEPYDEVREAATRLDGSIHLYITGRFEKAGWSPGEMPGNVHLTGFLDDKDYFSLLRAADVVMVLTKQKDCLVCGAYEGVSMEKPLVLSDQDVLRRYFSRGVIYTANTADSIARAIGEAIAGIEGMGRDIVSLKGELDRDWREKFETIERALR